jgi:hypothetical protein
MAGDGLIDFSCPQCNQWLQAPVTSGGTRMRCPECNALVDVPETGIAQEPQRPRPKTDTRPDDEYASGRDRDDDDDDRFDDVRHLRRPPTASGSLIGAAVCMLLTALLGLAVNSLGCIIALAGNAQIDQNAPPLVQELQKNTHGPVAASGQGLLALLSLITVLGSIQMLRRKTWGLGITACILSIINVGNCCCVLGLPFGIWGLVALANSETKDSFS